MTADWRSTTLAGVWRRSLTVHDDDRGAFAEIWRESWTATLPGGDRQMRQANLSRSHRGVLRGLHVHERQCDLWIIAEGRAFVALVDLRPALDERGPVRVETFDAHPGDAFFLPEAVAHGFYAVEALTLLYLVTNEYDGTDEHGFAWDDPMAAVPWPAEGPVISPRDAAAPPLAELLTRMRAGQQTPAR